MERDIERILISRKRISERVSALADSIGETYGADSEGLVIVPILAGSVIFLADLIRCLPFKMKIGLMTVSSYRGKTTSAGESRLIQDLNLDIEDRHVLVVDDILDTGSTLRLVVGELRQRRPASVRICVLLRKRSKAPRDFSVDFVGFDIEDVFVVGYGLDYNDHYRNWPDIGVLKPELYE
ncbi:MAG: hypoxanthine phosphoribosyltransferase [Planctomycetota bacterium]|nr:hypoxanthine phosphoribosyltransferase [Planctomycetota bacterium]MCZ6697975.1 hypoxanthine phosphoribosyltransferase [Planctomycetota bacterium]